MIKIEGWKALLQKTADSLKGIERRRFMSWTVEAGGQRQAERELGWNRGVIRRGQQEGVMLTEQRVPVKKGKDARGRKKAEEHLPNLLADIKEIVEPQSQTDPTFRTTQLYTPLTGKSVRERLLEEKGYTDEELPTARTIRTKMNELGYQPQKVAKSKPLKKIPETNAIFERLHLVNKEADETEGVLRLSWDAKASIKVGYFSRGGKSRQGEQAVDHDFKAEEKLGLFGIFLPSYYETHFFFTPGKVTADFMVDVLESLIPTFKERFGVHTLVINGDNGPESKSSRTELIKRMVELAEKQEIHIRLAYYPPYHSKYNPIERVWGVLENHWNGELLNAREKVLGLARSMTWNGHHPVVTWVEKAYESGVKVGKKAMATYEALIERLPGLEKWFVEIPPSHSISSLS